MPTFDEVWRNIQRRLSVGLELTNWSYNGRARGTTRIDHVYFDEIMVSGQNTAGSRPVKRTDFKKVYELWDRYKQGLDRKEIQKLSQNSTYIFCILHWLETSQENTQ